MTKEEIIEGLRVIQEKIDYLRGYL